VRVLVVSYAFPPVGGAGVQRVLKLVKYLPRSGITPAVLTARGASVPVLDASLEREVPDGVDVMRARTLEPAYSKKELAWRVKDDGRASFRARSVAAATAVARRLLVPDPQVLWLPAAAWTLARRLASRSADDVVFISGPPFSPFLLAGLARLRPGTAVVLDYRDEWVTTSTMYEMSASPSAAALLEERLLARAHAVTTATEEFRTALLQRFPFLDERRVVAIPNGYDPEDFPTELPSPPSDRFVLSYVGTIFRLTSARGFLDGLRLFHARSPELARSLVTRFIGRIVATESAHFEGTEALGVERVGYLEHHRAVAELASSHAALCILDDVEGVSRIYPAKIFEIMHLGRPCLALTPEGALARLVRRCRAGEVVPPNDTAKIAETLEHWVRRFLRDPHARADGPVDVERFDRREQARAFARVFRSALGIARHAPARAEPNDRPPRAPCGESAS
jgi:glycosyltransferase involved in cell wall biosynthesis